MATDASFLGEPEQKTVILNPGAFVPFNHTWISRHGLHLTKHPPGVRIPPLTR